jgi:hypothetical protein
MTTHTRDISDGEMNGNEEALTRDVFDSHIQIQLVLRPSIRRCGRWRINLVHDVV